MTVPIMTFSHFLKSEFVKQNHRRSSCIRRAEPDGTDSFEETVLRPRGAQGHQKLERGPC
jgi:hypothetical protein